MLAVTLALAGCGGSSSVSASAYVSAVCSAVGPFAHDVTTRAGTLQSALSGSATKSPAQGKALLKGFLDAISGDANTALRKVKAAGTPNVSNGKAISNRLVTVFTRLQSAVAGADRQAAALPTGSASSFRTAAAALGSNVQSSVSGIGSGLSTLKSPELQKAAAKSRACKSIGAA
jgi:hypothetical protein